MDASEYLIMGKSMLRLLKSMGLRYVILRKERETKGPFLSHQTVEKYRGPIAVVVRNGLISETA
jgi:hypothetical protein